MTVMSSLPAAGPLFDQPSRSAQSVRSAQPAPAQGAPLPAQMPSTIVTLGSANANASAQVYSPERVFEALGASRVAWQHQSNDAVSGIMGANHASTTLGGKFSNLGSALLERLRMDSADYAQSVTQLSDNALTRHSGNADIALRIKTASGVEVSLTLANQGGRLSVGISGGESLTEDERLAIANLAQGFQDALDGLTGKDLALKLEGLTRFDTTLLESVNLKASVMADSHTETTVEFNATAASRSITVSGPDGKLDLTVDTSNPAALGSRAQQSQAIDSYMRQANEAGLRGKANAGLMAMFKDAFVQMHGLNAPEPDVHPVARAPMVLSARDHAMLTGLADFQASITGETRQINPLRSNETEAFSYRFSQTTQVGGKDFMNREFSQSQHARLSASYYTPLTADGAVSLSSLRSSQNYVYNQIEDVTDSRTDVAYRKGALVSATLFRETHQSLTQTRYEYGDVVDKFQMPTRESQHLDLLEMITRHEKETSTSTADAQGSERFLEELHRLVLPQS